MSLTPMAIPSVPAETVRVARRAAFPKGNLYMKLRERVGTMIFDEDFAPFFAKHGAPELPPWRLAPVTILQFHENLSDRQAAEAGRARIDRKYMLSLELTDEGFDFSVLSEFRARLIKGDAADLLLVRLLECCRALGLVKTRGQQRTDSTHVVAAVRLMHRLELVGETLRAALNDLAVRAPAWVRAVAQTIGTSAISGGSGTDACPRAKKPVTVMPKRWERTGFISWMLWQPPLPQSICGSCRVSRHWK